jgi:hypothetical protein
LPTVPSTIFQLVTYLEHQSLVGNTIKLPSVTSIASGAAYLPLELREKASKLLGKGDNGPIVGDGELL